MLLSQIAKNCMDIVFPPVCAVCGTKLPIEKSGHFCVNCHSGIRFVEPPFCRICGFEVFGVKENNPLCGECLGDLPPYAIARSVVRYEPQVQKLIHKLKYGSDLSVLPGIMELIGCYDMAEFDDIDCIVMVPLHLQRLRGRGLNQAAVLARLFFADRLSFIQSDWMVRTRNTAPQTELGRKERRKNLRGSFQIRTPKKIQGASVCLVDDVFTTGTTVKECSKVIMESGADKVKVLTFARVNAPHSGRHFR